MNGKAVWIIGASSGIGAALAAELARRGARVVVSARRAAELVALAAGIPGAVAAPLDVCDAPSLKKAWQEYGPFDSVVYLAAVYRPDLLEDMTLDNARQMIDVNITGAINTIDSVYPSMIAARTGQIALCGSVAGYRGLPGGQPYSMTKAAIMNLAQSLKAEAQAHNVDIRLISPGFVRTPMTARNNFAMPMMIEPETAARAIADGLAGRAFEIHFPRPFTFLMKCIACLPNTVYFWLAERFLREKATRKVRDDQ